MSLGLAVLLMLKGYWYMDSIIENMIYIHDSMTFGGYNEQAEELKSIVSKVSAEKWKNRSESQQILLLYDLGCVEIEDNEIDFIITYEDLIAFSQNACSDTYINSCEELKKVLDSDELYTEIINEFKKC